MARISYDTWKEMFDLADAVWEDKPWQYVDNFEIVGLRFRDGKQVYVSLLGQGGESYALHVYSGMKELIHLGMLLKGAETGYTFREILGMTDMLSVDWDIKKFVLKDQKQAISKLKRQFEENYYPAFIHYKPGHGMPRYTDFTPSDAETMIKVMKAILSVSKQILSQIEIIGVLGRISLYMCDEQEDGTWTYQMHLINDEMIPTRERIEAAIREDLRSFPKSDVMMDIISISRTEQGEENRILLFMDHDSRIPLFFHVIENTDLPGSEIIHETFRSFVETANFLPKTVTVISSQFTEEELSEMQSIGIAAELTDSFDDMDLIEQILGSNEEDMFE